MDKVFKYLIYTIANILMLIGWSIGIMVSLFVIGLDAVRIYLFKRF